MAKNNSLKDLLKLEQDSVDRVVEFFDGSHDFDRVIYTDWTAKDVLAHIVMWHESFAHNVMDLIHERELHLLKGLLHEINENGVKEYKKYTIGELIEKLIGAQNLISSNIEHEKLKMIPYRRDSKRAYTREQHLEVTYKHIKGHYEAMLKQYKEPAQ